MISTNFCSMKKTTASAHAANGGVWQLLVILGVITVSAFAEADKSDVGSIPMTSIVNHQGQLTISIPIDVPPGTAGMTPSVALVYDSSAGNGIAGRGFSISGISYITREGRIAYLDNGVNGCVQLNTNDRLALDGKRLISVVGNYHGDATEYRTEMDAGTRIRGSIERSADGRAYEADFYAETKSGELHIFGKYGAELSEGESLMTAAMPADFYHRVIKWPLTKRVDRAGNTILYRYTNANGALLPREITYTGHSSGRDPYAAIRFLYQSRPDVMVRYVAGSRIVIDQRLMGIDVLHNGSVIRSYRFDYSLYEKASCIRRIRYNAGGITLRPIEFAWQYSTNRLSASTAIAHGFYSNDILCAEGTPLTIADVNNDGRNDIILTALNRVNISYDCGAAKRSNVSIDTVQNKWAYPTYNPFCLPITDTRFADFDGDGRLDAVCTFSLYTIYAIDILNPISLFNEYGVRRFFNNDDLAGFHDHTGFSWDDYAPMMYYGGKNFIGFSDMNGDGRDDYVRFDGNEIKVTTNRGESVNFFPNTVNAFSSMSRSDNRWSSNWNDSDGYWWYGFRMVPTHPTYYGLQSLPIPSNTVVMDRILCDVNRDGYTDIVGFGKDGVYVAVSDGRGCAAPARWCADFSAAQGYSNNGKTKILADVNGDGLPDIGGFDREGVFISLNTGTNFEQRSTWLYDFSRQSNWSETNHVRTLADMNGDGMADIVGMFNTGVWVALSTGTNFSAKEQWSTNYANDNGWNEPSAVTNAGTDGWRLGITYRTNRKRYIADMNGDGLPDIVGLWETNMSSVYNQRKPLRIQKIYDSSGNETMVEYKPLSDTNVHTKYTTAVYPAIDVQPAAHVVSSLKVPNGVGGIRETVIKYEGMRYDSMRHMNLNFAKIVSRDVVMNISTETMYSQEYPYNGLAASIVRRYGSSVCSRTTNTFKGFTARGGMDIRSVQIPYCESSRTMYYETGGIPTVFEETCTKRLDDFGNVLSRYEVKAGFTEAGGLRLIDPRTIRYTMRYDNDPTAWLIGMLREVNTTNERTGYETVNTTVGYDYYTSGRAAGKVFHEIIAPNTGVLVVTNTYSYDDFGNRTATVVSAPACIPRTNRTEYDTAGRFAIREINALGHETTKGYHVRFGTVTNVVKNGLANRFILDDLGRQTAMRETDGTYHYTVYSPSDTLTTCPQFCSYLIEEHSARGDYTYRYYDRFDRLLRESTKIRLGKWSTIDYQYNERGELAKRSYPYNNGSAATWVEFYYDYASRLIRTIDNGRQTRTEYQGLTNYTYDERGKQTKTVKDAVGNIISITDAANKTLRFTYRADGSVKTSVDEQRNTRTNFYDARGRVVRTYDPDIGYNSNTYNPYGECVFSLDAAGTKRYNSYDSLGRLEHSEVPGSGYTHCSYDTQVPGLLSDEWRVNTAGTNTVGNVNGTYRKEYTYDTLGRIITSVENCDGTVCTNSITYDAYSRVSSMTYPRGVQPLTITNQYDTAGRLLRVKDYATGVIYHEVKSVDAADRLLSDSLGAITGDYRYDIYGRLTSVRSGGGTLVSLTNEFDAAGNCTYRADTVVNASESFTYDDVNRMTTATTRQSGAVVGVLSMEYDAIGNIKRKSDRGTYGYHPALRPHAVTNAGGNVMTYDNNGNMTSDAARDIIYTAENKPSRIFIERAVTIYDFIARAATATWKNSTGAALPFNNDNGNGIVRVNNEVFETGARVTGLVTVPNNISDGFIRGRFSVALPQTPIYFRATVGLVYASGRTKAVRCSVYYEENGALVLLASQSVNWDGVVNDIIADCSHLAGRTINFIIEANANGDCANDNAFWTDCRIVQPRETTAFSYGCSGDRVTKSTKTTHTVYSGSGYERDTTAAEKNAGDLGFGIAMKDNEGGIGYILYSEMNVHTRLHPSQIKNSEHFIIVKYIDNRWYWFNDEVMQPFTPASGDVIVAEIDLSANTVLPYLGRYSELYGIPSGYFSGNIAFVPEKWNNLPDPGEVFVTGTTFCPVKSIIRTGQLGKGLFGNANASGYGYIMHSTQAAVSRFSPGSSVPGTCENFVIVRYSNNRWYWLDNSEEREFTPRSDDRIVAAVDFTADTITPLRGIYSRLFGIPAGFVGGDIVFIPDLFDSLPNDGKISVGGTYFATVEMRTVDRYYVSSDKGVVATISARSDSPAAEVHSLITDHLGSPIACADAAGVLVQRLSFDAFGKGRTTDWRAGQSPRPVDRKGFTGHEDESESGLVNMKSRLYDPAIGRFLQADSIVPSSYNMQCYNRYSYVYNNPLSLVDTTGHFGESIFGDSGFGSYDMSYDNTPSGYYSWNGGFTYNSYEFSVSGGSSYFNSIGNGSFSLAFAGSGISGTMGSPFAISAFGINNVNDTSMFSRALPGAYGYMADEFKNAYNGVSGFLNDVGNVLVRTATQVNNELLRPLARELVTDIAVFGVMGIIGTRLDNGGVKMDTTKALVKDLLPDDNPLRKYTDTLPTYIGDLNYNIGNNELQFNQKFSSKDKGFTLYESPELSYSFNTGKYETRNNEKILDWSTPKMLTDVGFGLLRSTTGFPLTIDAGRMTKYSIGAAGATAYVVFNTSIQYDFVIDRMAAAINWWRNDINNFYEKP